MRQAVIFDLKAMFLVLALVMPMVMVPVGTAQAQESVKETNIEVALTGSLPEEVINAINSNGAEIEIMENGTPVIIVEVEKKGYEETYYIPLTLPSTIEIKNITDGSKTTVEVDGNYLLIPVVEDDEIEIERVCISDFDVKEIKFDVKEIKNDGQVVLVGEVNPRAILIVIGVLVGEAVISYVVSEIIDKWRNRRSIESKDDPILIWRGRDIVLPVPLFDIRTPPQKLDGFEVIVEAFDVNRGEVVNVYLGRAGN